MKVRFSKEFIEQYKKADVRIRKRVDQQIDIFSKNPIDLSLRNHTLREEYEGQRSIGITSDWRAIYREVKFADDEPYAYFTALGTHSQLYG